MTANSANRNDPASSSGTRNSRSLAMNTSIPARATARTALLHILAHGVGKTVLFLAGGQLQAAHDSTAIGEITAVLHRSRLVGGAFAVGMVVLLGLPPFAMFASELAIAISLADARLTWALGMALVALVVAFAALVRNSGRILLGSPSCDSPAIQVPRTVAAALVTGVLVSIALGVTAGPLSDLFASAASQLGAR